GRGSKRKEAGDIGPSLDVAESLSTVATLYRASGAYEAALPLYRRALLLRESNLDLEHLCVAQSRSSLAELYQILGNYEPALSLFRQVLVVRERKLGAHHRDVAQARNNLASLYRSIGLYPRAEELYRAALESRLRLGEDHPDVAESLHDLGSLYRLTGDYAAAEHNYQRALQLRRNKLGPGLEVAQSLSALGGLYRLTGDYRRAEPLYREALEIRQKKLSADHPDVAESQADLADLHLAMGDFARAEPLYQRALEIRRSKLGPDHPAVARSLGALAALYRARGDLGKAEDALVQARDIYIKRFGPEHPEVAQTLHQMGMLAHAAGRYPRAEELYRQALSIRSKKLGPDHPEVAESLTHQATLLVATGRAAQALPLLKRSLAISEQMLRSVGLVSGESRIDALLKVLRAQEEIIYSLLTERQVATQAAPLAMTVALLRKGRSVDEAAGTSRAIYRGLGAEDRQRFEQIKALRSQIAHERLAGLDHEATERVRRLSEQADQIEQELSRTSAPLRARGRLPGADEIVQKVAGALPHDGALVEIVAFRPYHFHATGTGPRWQALRYVALVLRPDGQVRVADLGLGEPIHQSVQEFLTHVTSPMQVAGKREREAALRASEPRVLMTGQALYRRVLAPLQPMLAGVRQLFLSLDGQLHLVPLGALHDGTAYALDRYRLIYLTSGRDLLRRDDDLQPSTSVTLLARPAFMKLPLGWKEPAGGARGLDLVPSDPAGGPPDPAVREASMAGGLRLRSLLDPLQGTEQEARVIKKLLPGATLLLGAAATKEALLKVEAPGILHVATHGLFRPSSGRGGAGMRGLDLVGEGVTQALRSATPEDLLLGSMLLLAGVGTPIQHADGPGVVLHPAGLATALEVAGMNLWGTQLVVLSACETGRGDISNLGQGVYGLRRAVMVAGAETLVTSLWKVDDEATRDLMTRYYRNLLAGRGRVEAMDEAAQYVRTRRPHVAYWAPFIVIGQSNPLQGLGKGAGKATRKAKERRRR
ncbi:MAG: CHAT domain-containing tetratricopeptide repeat protein, partial [Myxococcales bacterium]|nr:CHAT domain-containing tetratricopeptide repeat protein [Myxococcales bacterium]